MCAIKQNSVMAGSRENEAGLSGLSGTHPPQEGNLHIKGRTSSVKPLMYYSKGVLV